MPEVIFERPLTGSEMEAILGEESGAEAVIRFFRIAMGDEAWETATKVDPTRFIIPKDQWTEIAGNIRRKFPDADDGFREMFRWMNSGPSSI